MTDRDEPRRQIINLDHHRHARQAGRYSAVIQLALADMEYGDYAGAHKTLKDAAREIRNDDRAAMVRVQSGQ